MLAWYAASFSERKALHNASASFLASFMRFDRAGTGDRGKETGDRGQEEV